MKVTILTAIILVLGFNFISAQTTDYYISPGVQIGYCFGRGMTWSVEVSVGGSSTFDYPPYFSHLSLSLGVQKIADLPTTFPYVNLNTGILAFGVSLGQSFYDSGDENLHKIRYGFYSGLFIGFIQYENITNPLNSQSLHGIGLWGKIPIKIPDKKGENWRVVYSPT